MSRGIVAVGDSVMNGYTYPQVGVGAQSWAAWLALAADLPITRYSVGGATSQRVLDEQVPRVGDGFDVAALSVGANDMLLRVPTDTFRRNLTLIVAALTGAAGRVLVTNLPDRFGSLPGMPVDRATATAANTAIREVAVEHGALVVDVRDLAGPRFLRADRVHPTALGQLEIADRAAELLGVPAKPSTLPVTNPRAPLGVVGSLGYRLDTARQASRWVAKRAIRRA